MRILKFGSTSVATSERRGKVAEIVHRAAEKTPLVVVVSALRGVSEMLVSALDQARHDDVAERYAAALLKRHLEGLAPAAEERARTAMRPLLRELQDLLQGIRLVGECPPGARHRVLAAGERLAVPLVLEALRERGIRASAVDGAELIVVSSKRSSEVDLEATGRLVRKASLARAPGEVSVVSGLIARDAEGRTTTLGRGASELTATVLARVLEADIVEIRSDVDGILCAPPELVPTARPLDFLSYGEAAGLAHFGAEVLHPRMLEPVAALGIPVTVKNTLHPEAPGTRIGETPRNATVRGGGSRSETGPAAEPWLGNPGPGARAISLSEPHVELRLSASWDFPFLTSRAFAVLERLGVRPLLSVRGASAQTLTFLLRLRDVERFERALPAEIPPGIVETRRREGVSVVTVLSASTPRVAREILQTLEENGLEPLSLSLLGAGDAEDEEGRAVAVVLEARDGRRATRLLYDALIAGRPPRWSAGWKAPAILADAGPYTDAIARGSTGSRRPG